MSDDLYLTELNHFNGTETYHSLRPLFHTLATDGIDYVMRSGYSWLVTDALACIETAQKGTAEPEEDLGKLIAYLKTEDAGFLAIKLKLFENTEALVEISDGNDNILHTQSYGYTDAKKELILYWQEGANKQGEPYFVIMLSNEY